MYVNFNHLKFKNLNSYGNSVTTFDFVSGLNLISGQNGQGKSSIIDAFCFCLFGVPFRKIKKNELINRTNKKDLWTLVNFNVGDDVFEIVRGIKPDILSITKNGTGLDLLSTKKLTQEEIDKIIGLDLTLFRQIISLSVNYSKPFLSLTNTEKKDIIETIFNIKVFGDMFKALKVENTSIKSEHDINSKTIHLLEDNIRQMNGQIISLTNTKNTFDVDKAKQISEIESNIGNLSRKLRISDKHIKWTIDCVNSFMVSNVDSKEISIINQEIGKIDGEVSRSNKDITFFDTNPTCPVCNSDMTDAHRDSHKVKLSLGLSEMAIKKSSLVEQRNDIQRQLDIKAKQEKKLGRFNNRLSNEKNKSKFYKEQLKSYTDTLKTATEKIFNYDIDSLKSDYEKKKEEYKVTYKRTGELKQTININDIIFGILGNEGIKSHFFSKLIPILNQKINDYLEKFDIAITVTFNEYMEETISNFSDSNISYGNFSDGEKKRIDIAILLSFIETTKVISNWSCNVLFFDELLDTSTDEEGLTKIIEAVKDFIINDSNLCVYVMSHRSNDSYFDNIYRIEKNSGFSVLV